MTRLWPALLAGLAVGVPQSAAAYDRLPTPLARLSPAYFAGKVRISEDPLGETVTFSTYEGYQRGRSLKGAYAADVHLRAHVDRGNGRVTWQVWHDLITIRGHKAVVAVEYRAGGIWRVVRPSAVHHGFSHCPPTDAAGSCNQVTRIAFELPETAVREIAAAGRGGAQQPWQLRFKDASGRDVTGGIAPAEVAGLVAALDAWRETRTAHREN